MPRPSVNCHEIVTYGDIFIAINLGMGGFHEQSNGTLIAVRSMWNTVDYNFLKSSYDSGLFKGSQKRSVRMTLKSYEKKYSDASKLRNRWKSTPYFEYMLPSFISTTKKYIKVNNDGIIHKYKQFHLCNGDYVWYGIGFEDNSFQKMFGDKSYYTEEQISQMSDYQSVLCNPYCAYKDYKINRVSESDDKNFIGFWGSDSDRIVILAPLNMMNIIDGIDKALKNGSLCFIPEEHRVCRMCGAILIDLDEAYKPRL